MDTFAALAFQEFPRSEFSQELRLLPDSDDAFLPYVTKFHLQQHARDDLA